MKIFLHEITDQDTELDFTQEEKWVAEAVERIDEKWDGESRVPHAQAKVERPIQAHFNLRKVDEIVVVSGNINTSVNLICSRCAQYYAFETRPAFSALFCKDPVMAGVAHLKESGRPAGQNRGFARHAHDESAEEEGESSMESGQNIDITYISNDFIDLSDVLSEQLQLQIPFQPLCRESCKGVCTQCGADQNKGRCACAKLTASKPFSVLKDFKVE